ncbi:MAG TPA: YbaK/EbsC family protein [Xanthobacteraceae bacterium]|jgi:Ala-tRNA(Pro) deacylase
MTTALTLEQYLAQKGIAYDVLPHAPAESSLRTAAASHVPADKLAKAVVLKKKGGYLLAVLPASQQLAWKTLGDWLHQDVALASEEEICWLLPDCTTGAVPPIGDAYGIETIVDDSITHQPDVYFEAGDHATLVHMDGPAFDKLMASAKHGRFSVRH